mmetsp:Transcript_8819/g.20832  ORF Transcript_8819/g.20832 Transcript_8819/m.20832 type:complete len:228 (-) Transcript_8819:119-802(-)
MVRRATFNLLVQLRRRRRRWPDAGSRLDPPAFERAQALTLADRGSANFGEGLRHIREALTFAQPAPLPIPRLLTAFALCQKENEFACRRPLTRRRGPCGDSQPPWVGVRDPVARDAAWPPLERAQTVVGPPPQPDGVNGSRHFGVESSRILRTRRHFSCEAPRHGAPPHDRSFDNEPPRAGQRRLNHHTHSLHTHTHLISPYSIHHHPPPSPQPTRSADSPPTRPPT